MINGQSNKILIIEDDPDIGTIIKIILEQKGYLITVSENVDAAASILQNGGTGLIIMDMLLPGTTGVDICKRFKNDPSVSFIPVIMMSAHPDAKRLCEEAGADGFISKPFHIQEVLSRIDQFLGKAM